MHRFFVEPSQIGEKEIVITGPDVNHIRNVLRMRAGEELLAADGQGSEYRCILRELQDSEIRAEICRKLSGSAELPSRITLFQGLPKSDKMDLIIQKCVELGVFRIVPVTTKRTVVKLDAKKEESRRKRWTAVSESAAKLSQRTYRFKSFFLFFVEISGVRGFKEAVEEAGELDVCLIPYEKAEDMARTREILSGIPAGASIGVFIGPEGGFEEEEVREAMEAGARPITLGRRILRTETAGMAVLAMLGYLLEE